MQKNYWMKISGPKILPVCFTPVIVFRSVECDNVFYSLSSISSAGMSILLEQSCPHCHL